MKRTSISHSLIGSMVALIAAIAVFDYQVWLLEQLYERFGFPMQWLLAIEAIVSALVAIGFYKITVKLSHRMQLSNNGLTSREKEVLTYIIEGKSNKDIESSLFIERSTLKSHINRIYKKLNVQDRQELIHRYSDS